VNEVGLPQRGFLLLESSEAFPMLTRYKIRQRDYSLLSAEAFQCLLSLDSTIGSLVLQQLCLPNEIDPGTTGQNTPSDCLAKRRPSDENDGSMYLGDEGNSVTRPKTQERFRRSCCLRWQTYKLFAAELSLSGAVESKDMMPQRKQ
jgi:hypothetical protein